MEKAWKEVNEAARLLSVTTRAVRKWVQAGRLNAKYVPSVRGGGQKGQKLLVEIEMPASESSSIQYPVALVAPPRREEIKFLHEQEPSKSLALANRSFKCDPGNSTEKIREKALRIASFRFSLLQKLEEDLRKNGRKKTEIISEFLQVYNAGLLLPQVFSEIGPVSRSTLYNWMSRAEAGVDALVPEFGVVSKQTKIREEEKEFLRRFLLNQNRPSVGFAIRMCKEVLGERSVSSPATLRRWVNTFKMMNYDVWTLERGGEKALSDQCLPYAERDWRKIQVGEGLVADGHKLNFHVINPQTGKPCRATLVLFWDWHSSYPLGWEIMLTENVQSISTALRNAILELGKIPVWVLLDNGKAFKADVFTSRLDLRETELPGMFARLGIRCHFSMPYNAQAKPVERFFRVFGDWFERLLPSYVGASVDDKPAWLQRNEKRARTLRGEFTPTIPQVNEMMQKWREFYISQPLRGRDNLTARELFDHGKGAGVDPKALCYLMMAADARTVHRNGVTWMGWHWYDPALYGYRDRVVIRYSFSDLRQIYIFSTSGEFLCAARPVEKVHPMGVESECPKDWADAKRITSQQRALKKETKKIADLIRRGSTQPSAKEITPEDIASFLDEQQQKSIPIISPFPDEAEVQAKGQAKIDTTDVEPESAPTEPIFEWNWEWYDHLMKKDPASYTEKERRFLDYYVTTSEYKSIYGKKAQGGVL